MPSGSELRRLILEDDNVRQIILQIIREDTRQVVIRDVYEVRTRQEKESTLLEIAVKCLIFRHLPADAPPVVVVIYPTTVVPAN